MLRKITLAIILTACDGESAIDAGSDSATLDGGTAFDPAPPTPPAPVAWTTCPTGWRSIPAIEGTDLAMVCEPWPSTGRAVCTGTSAHFAGEPGCSAIGGACDAEEWPADLPVSGVIYVQTGATGDGSRAAPFGSIAQAISSSSSGDIIALHSGTYAGPVALPAGVSLHGACPATTTIEIATAGTAGNVRVTSGTASIRSLRLTGPQPGISVSGGATLDVRDVVIEQAGGIGIFVNGSGTTLRAENLIVRGTQPDGTGRFGIGIDVEGGARAEVVRAVLDHNTQAGVLVFDAGSVFDGRGIVALDTEQRPADNFGGNGLRASEGGTVIAEASIVEQNRRSSVLADTGGHVVLRDSVVRETREGALAGGDLFPIAHGLSVQEGATAELARVWLDRHGDVAAYVTDAGSTLTGEDVVVTRTQSRLSDGQGGEALFVQVGARVELTRVAIAEAREASIGCFEAGTQIVLYDARIHDTLARTAGARGGRAISLENGCALTIERATIEDSRDIAVAVRTGSSAILRDTRVSRVEPDNLLRGYGVLVALGSSATIDRAAIEDSTEAGLVIGTDSRVDAVDLSISGTRPDAIGILGRGLHAQANGVFDGERVSIVGNHEIGVCVALGASIALRSALVADTHRRTCGDACPSGEGGFGLAVYEASALTVDGFVVRDNDLAGLVVQRGTARLTSGVVSGHPVGVNIQDDRDPSEIIGEGVTLEGNDLDVDATILALPDPSLGE